MGTTRHETFTVTSKVEAPPAAVFAAVAEPERRRRWIRMPGSGAQYSEDLRVGGFDVASSTFRLPDEEQRLLNTAVYLEIVPDRRLVWSYTAAVDDLDRWASLVTVELDPDRSGTTLSWTEQVAFLIASEPPEDDLLHLRGAIRLRLNGLAAALSSARRQEESASAGSIRMKLPAGVLRSAVHALGVLPSGNSRQGLPSLRGSSSGTGHRRRRACRSTRSTPERRSTGLRTASSRSRSAGSTCSSACSGSSG